MMKSWKQSFIPGGLAGRGISFNEKSGFGSFRNNNGSFLGYMDDAMDSSEPFNPNNGDNYVAYSFTGRNGSFRSPSALGIPLPLGSFTGGQSYGMGKSIGGMSMVGKSLNGSTNWGRVKSNIMRKEADFCKDYMCCGEDLGNLHDLLEHYEEAHVVVVNSPSSASQMDLALEMDPDSKWAYGGDDMDVDMEAFDEESPSSGSNSVVSSTNTSPMPGHALPTGSTAGTAVASALKQLALDDVLKSSSAAPTSSRTKSSDDISAFDSFVVSSPPKALDPDLSSKKNVKTTSLAASRRAMHGGINGRTNSDNSIKNAFGLNVRRQSPEPAKTTTGFDAVAPNVLFTHSASTPVVPTVSETTIAAQAVVPAPVSANTSPVSSHSNPVGWKSSTPAAAQSDLTPQPSLFSTHRPFRCPQPGCQKSYKQANGLKYHMLKGQCNFEVRDAMEWAGLSQEEAEERAKPYACAAGDGCLKRYRQANGLKYHYMNSGLHGEIGLILLAQGQHPMPNMLPKETKPRPVFHPVTSRPGARAAGLAPGGWIKNAVRNSGKELGLPLSGTDNPRTRKGEDAVLFSTDEILAL